MVGYRRRSFVAATACASALWAAYAFFIGRLGGRAFEDRPWVGLLLALAVALVLSILAEVLRRTRPWRVLRRVASRDHAAQDPGPGAAPPAAGPTSTRPPSRGHPRSASAAYPET